MKYQTQFDKNAANLLSRFFALIIDALILLIPSFILMLPSVYLSLKASQESGQQIFYLQLSTVMVSLLSSFYRPLFFFFKGMTPGMKAMGLQLVGVYHDRPTLTEAFKRELPNLLYIWLNALSVLFGLMFIGPEGGRKFLILSILPWPSTLLWIVNNAFLIFTSNLTSLGDRWARTIMVQKG